jgi:site-specific DNA-methyltransferase (adenine-specific)
MIPSVRLMHGDCREIIATLDDNSIHSIVTDPPYELGFMGKKWDNSGIAYDLHLWTECLRVLKPGGHLLAFGGTRTYHRMACAIEDAGFELRDSICWLYGSGFPKSHDVSKALDKAAGAEREVIGRYRSPENTSGSKGSTTFAPGSVGKTQEGLSIITAPATDAAKQWQGWGTALKPAHEPIVVARKPLVGTVAANVLQHGTGALNIDGCRVGFASEDDRATAQSLAELRARGRRLGVLGEPGQGNSLNAAVAGDTRDGTEVVGTHARGRWPANVITDGSIDAEWVRYFYSAKPSKRERNAGLEALPISANKFGNQTNGADLGNGSVNDKFTTAPAANTHPTVKPLALMRYLVRLVTPPGGTVLEPFAGSGTTLVAAVLEGFNAIGCELTDEYLPIINNRIQWAHEQRESQTESLFPE